MVKTIYAIIMLSVFLALAQDLMISENGEMDLGSDEAAGAAAERGDDQRDLYRRLYLSRGVKKARLNRAFF